MDKKKFGAMGLAVYVILFAVYNMLIFMLFSGKNNIFWISYGFFIVAFLMHMCCVYFTMKNLSVRTAFFGIPLISFSNYFLLAELFVSFVFMVFRRSVGPKLCVAVQVVLLAIYLIIAIISITSREYVANVTERVAEDQKIIQNIRGEIESLMQQCQHAEAKEMLRQAAEAARYANQKSDPSVSMIDNSIRVTLNQLKAAYNIGDLAGLERNCRDLVNEFSDRNRTLNINS